MWLGSSIKRQIRMDQNPYTVARFCLFERDWKGRRTVHQSVTKCCQRFVSITTKKQSNILQKYEGYTHGRSHSSCCRRVVASLLCHAAFFMTPASKWKRNLVTYSMSREVLRDKGTTNIGFSSRVRSIYKIHRAVSETVARSLSTYNIYRRRWQQQKITGRNRKAVPSSFLISVPWFNNMG